MTDRTRFWRGGPLSAMPADKSALDVVRYETQDLGNTLQVFADEPMLAAVPARTCVWLTTTRAYARTFGTASPVWLTDYRVLASDGDGGLLIHSTYPF